MKNELYSVLVGAALMMPVAAFAEDGDHEAGWGEHGVSVEEVMEFVGTHSPPFHEALIGIREEAPEEFEERVEAISHFIREFREVRREEPEAAQLMLTLEVKEIESELIARRFHESENPERKAKLREQLAHMLNQLFELKQHANEKELHDLEREVSELRQRFQRRAEHRQEIIERRMRDLLEVDGDDWMDW